MPERRLQRRLVHVVIARDYEEAWIVGVFTSRALAETTVATLITTKKRGRYGWQHTTEWDVASVPLLRKALANHA